MKYNCGIYKIFNKINGYTYYGLSNNLCERWYNHKWALNSNRHDNPYLQRAWNKYGENVFEFKIKNIRSGKTWKSILC